jgi:ADP-ribose pyrophosphatase YjhB (NUDIX family)
VRNALHQALAALDSAAPDPSQGLPDPVFYYISRTTPLINVDLLVGDRRHGVLLAWRDDRHSGVGWHLPGGIIRYKERIAERVRQVALHELKAEVVARPGPLALHEIIAEPQRDRAHFISLLYRCDLAPGYQIDNQRRRPDEPGFLAWHPHCPADLLSWHEIYRPYIDGLFG